MNQNHIKAKDFQSPQKSLRCLDDVLNELLGFAKPLNAHDSAFEIISTLDADRRVLLQDVVSSLQVPSFDNSAMDGYAVRCADVAALGATLPISQRVPAGVSPEPLKMGTAARIFTGAPIPLGADAVVMQEDCTLLTTDSMHLNQSKDSLHSDAAFGSVQFNQVPKWGWAIRRAGEDVERSSVVLAAGERLNPASIGLAASVGYAHLKVAKKLRVALFSTGDELVMPGEVEPEFLPKGAIYNSNRFFLAALLNRFGCQVTDLGIVPDSLEATKEALKKAASSHDVIVTSGGVSVGEEDHVKAAVQTLGQLALWQLAIKPGKPFAYGQIAQEAQGNRGFCHFVGLPGNPVSSWVTFLMLLRPFLLKLQGVDEALLKPPQTLLPAHFERAKADKRREFLRVKRNEKDGLDLFKNQSSGVLTSAVWADGFVDLPAGQTVAYSDLVSFISFSDLIN